MGMLEDPNLHAIGAAELKSAFAAMAREYRYRGEVGRSEAYEPGSPEDLLIELLILSMRRRAKTEADNHAQRALFRPRNATV